MSEHGCISPRVGDLLGAYEMGLLAAAERQTFEQHLAECPACLEELYEGAVAAEALRADPRHYAEMLRDAARATEPSRADKLGRLLRQFVRPRMLGSVASVAAVAVALMIFLPTQLPTQLPTTAGLAVIEPLPYQTLQLRGGPGGELEQLLASGLEHYAAGDYRAAAGKLAPVWEQAGGDEEWNDRHQAALFLGLCLLLEERPGEALAPLAAARKAALLPVAERGTWYLAQAHLLRDEPLESLPLLESLLKSPVYGDRAAAQLLSVREICDTSHGE